MADFVLSVLGSLTASVLFDAPTMLYAYIQKNKPIEEKLKNAFNAAVRAYFQDELQQNRVIALEQSNYIEMLKKELVGEPLELESEKYKKLYTYFNAEIVKDEVLADYVQIEQGRVSQKLIRTNSKEIREAISSYSKQLIGYAESIKEEVIQLKRKVDTIANRTRMPKQDGRVFLVADKELTQETTVCPVFWKKKYVPKSDPDPILSLKPSEVVLMSSIKMLEYQIKREAAEREAVSKVRVIRQTIYHNYCPIQLVVANYGEIELRDLQVIVTIDDKRVKFAETNVKEYGITNAFKESSYFIDEDGNEMSFRMERLGIYMQSKPKKIFVNVPKKIKEFTLSWTISAGSYPLEGKLKIYVKHVYKSGTIQDNARVGQEDYIEPYEEWKE